MKIIAIECEKGIETCQYARGKPCTSDARFKVRKIRSGQTFVSYLCRKHYELVYQKQLAENLITMA